MNKISVIGDGGWGTALSIELFRNGRIVSLWGAFPDYVEKVAKSRENVKFLKGVKIPEGVDITAELDSVLSGAEIVILAVPSKYLRSVLIKIKAIKKGRPIYASAVKGI